MTAAYEEIQIINMKQIFTVFLSLWILQQILTDRKKFVFILNNSVYFARQKKTTECKLSTRVG